ncbi:MAG: hypothetical protein QGG40_12205 [Myxococcota bacterium]|jgi:hypothetical protein|nr:hypothetical protein [Myxococcota bacterium]
MLENLVEQLRSAPDRLRSEADRLRVEADRLRAEANRLVEDADKLRTDATSVARQRVEVVVGDGQEQLWLLETRALQAMDELLGRAVVEWPVVKDAAEEAEKLVTERLDGILAVPVVDYADLNARKAMAAIKDLGRVDLLRVRRFEAENKNRKTVLAAIDRELKQLKSGTQASSRAA